MRKLKFDARIECTHSIKQKEYLFWKYQELQRWCGAPPHLGSISDARYNKRWWSWRFATHSHQVFTQLSRVFYQDKVKIIPRTINQILTSPLSLAVWYMDDGGRRNDSYGVFLNTLSFKKLENEYLRNCLKKNFNIDSRIHWISDGYRLYIPSSAARKFCGIIYPHLLDIFHYKLSYNPVTTSFARLDRARDRSLSTSITRQL